MFKFVALMFAVLAVHSQADAQMHKQKPGGCQRSQQKFICPGDRVVDSSGYNAVVVGVNPFSGNIVVSYGGPSSVIHTLSSLALAEGCVAGLCVGDRVVDSSGYNALVSAVNPFRRTVAINYGGTTSSHQNPEALSVTFGCIQGLCIGDRVIDSSGYSAIIVAINFARHTVAVNYGGSTSVHQRPESLSVTNYCADYPTLYREMTSYSGGRMQDGQPEQFPFSPTRNRR